MPDLGVLWKSKSVWGCSLFATFGMSLTGQKEINTSLISRGDRVGAGSLEKTSSGTAKLLNHPRDRPSVQDWCWMLWRLQLVLGYPCVLQKLLFPSPRRHFDQHSDPGSRFFRLPLTYARDECIRQYKCLLCVFFVQFSLENTHIVILPPILFFPYGEKMDQLADLGQVSEQGLLVSGINQDGVDGEGSSQAAPVRQCKWNSAFLSLGNTT